MLDIFYFNFNVYVSSFLCFQDMKVDSYMGVIINEKILVVNEILLNEERMHAQKFCDDFPISVLSCYFLY